MDKHTTGEEIDELDENNLNGFGIGENGFINVLTPGAYEIQITDYNGCQNSWEFNVFDNPEPINWANINTLILVFLKIVMVVRN